MSENYSNKFSMLFKGLKSHYSKEITGTPQSLTAVFTPLNHLKYVWIVN